MKYEARLGPDVRGMVLDEWVQRVQFAGHDLTEKRLRVLVKPKPRWLPAWAWRWLMARLIVLEESSPNAGSVQEVDPG